MVLDGSTLAVESVVGSALEALLAGAVELAAAELAKDGRAGFNCYGLLADT